jgi:aspartyl-tRNA(Asn)/glutamyl-tRNA(Gln) amidotransferase subunit B
MEEGSLRADANVSINFPGKGLGRKVEIKNLNSSRFVRLGLNYEIARQGLVLDAGKEVVQETRLWNENRDETQSMRQKENAQDYRYFPEPDLPVFTPDAGFLKSVEEALVELPVARMKRLEEEYGLTGEQADLICEEKNLADYFEKAVEAAAAGLTKKDAAGRICKRLLGEIKHILYRENIPLGNIGGLSLSPARLASLTLMQAGGLVSGKNAKQALEEAITGGRDPAELIRERGWGLITDPGEIAELVKKVGGTEAGVFEEARAALAEGNARRGRTLTAFLVGKVLEASGGRADPKIAGRQIEELIQGGPCLGA